MYFVALFGETLIEPPCSFRVPMSGVIRIEVASSLTSHRSVVEPPDLINALDASKVIIAGYGVATTPEPDSESCRNGEPSVGASNEYFQVVVPILSTFEALS